MKSANKSASAPTLPAAKSSSSKFSTGVRDLVQLKLQKKLLREQLSQNLTQQQTLNTILEAKRHQPGSSMYIKNDPVDCTMDFGGKTLHELRPATRYVW